MITALPHSLAATVLLLKRPAIAMLVERVLRLVSAAVVTVLVARALGAESLGVLAVVMAWAAFLVPLAGLGLNHNVIRYISTTEHAAQARAVLYSAILMRLAFGVVLGLALVMVFNVVTASDGSGVSWLAICALFMGHAAYSFVLFEFFLNYRDHFHQVAYAKVVVTAVALSSKLLLLLAGAGINTLLVVMGLEFVLVGLAQYLWFRRLHRNAGDTAWPHLHRREFRFAPIRSLLRGARWLWVAGIVSVLYLKLDLLMIGSLLGSEQAGIYAAASRLSELWYVLPATLAMRYYPDLLARFQRDESAYLFHLRRRVSRFFLAGCAVAVFMSILAPLIIGGLFGPEFLPAVDVLRIHVWAGCFIFTQHLIHQHLLITEQEPMNLVSHGGGALINLLLNLWLIPAYGIEGAAWATLVSYAFAAFFFLLLARRTRAQLWRAMTLRSTD